MHQLTCPTRDCRITFEVPAELKAKAVEKGQAVHCPNGHRIVWPEQSDVDVERKRTEFQKGVTERYRDLYHDKDWELREVRRLLKTCPGCGWRSRRRNIETIRADMAQHLSEKHGMTITEELEEALRDA